LTTHITKKSDMESELVLDMPTIDAGELAGLLESEAPVQEEGMLDGELNLEMSDDEDDEDAGEGDVGASAAHLGGGGGDDGSLDDAGILQLGKREAKLMGKALYKRWKKLTKKSSKKDGEKRKKKSSSSDKHKEHSKKSSGRQDDDDGKESKKKSDSKKRSRAEDMFAGSSGYPGTSAAAHLGEHAAPLRTTRSSKSTTGGGSKNGPAKLSAAQKQLVYQAEAKRIVQMMQEHRIRDENARRVGQPPLHRLGITQDVASVCRRAYMHRFLVEEGILSELSHWIYDMELNELGPLDLRTLALDLLSGFEVRGIRKMGTPREDEEFDEAKAAKRVDDLDAYRGVCREDLEGTSLGTAVNRLRTNELETDSNKKVATLLLQRLSRAFQHRRDDDDEAQPVVEVQWRCKGDATVAPPFDPVVSASDAFQQRMFQPDPLDPMSYLRCPPRRYNKGYVTNLSHMKVQSRGGAQH
jgi:hypothetical protein